MSLGRFEGVWGALAPQTLCISVTLLGSCMARTEHLPILRASYDLCLYLEQVVHRFSRYHQYTLGTDLRDAERG